MGCIGALLGVDSATATEHGGAPILRHSRTIARFASCGHEDRRSLYDLPLGDTPLWTLREETVRTFQTREEHVEAVLPCWSAESRHDLTPAALGFAVAATAVRDLARAPGLRYDAVQSAAARYGRYGFEAAAVTAFAMATGLPPEGVRRTAQLRFGHPYAVVAVATDERPGGPWHGLPVFSAWVAEPEELPEADAADPH